ncbi:hypothetical protein RRG08_052519 [Elysia crispata]|uniref:Uncharacterized protein n=1 Tax=Elysia crispata TaxID=231223 RepID=A0AAE0ZHA4_9GAST|nr:hypothetical protein RRG08_052519 [Elysia crispata]
MEPNLDSTRSKLGIERRPPDSVFEHCAKRALRTDRKDLKKLNTAAPISSLVMPTSNADHPIPYSSTAPRELSEVTEKT